MSKFPNFVDGFCQWKTPPPSWILLNFYRFDLPQGDFTLTELSTGWLGSSWTTYSSLAVFLVTFLLEYFGECTIRVTVLLLECLKFNWAFLYVVAFCCTVKLHLVATSLIRPPHYSGHIWKVPTCFPYYLIDQIFINKATSLIRPAATFYRTKWTKSMKMSLNKAVSDWTGTIYDKRYSIWNFLRNN